MTQTNEDNRGAAFLASPRIEDPEPGSENVLQESALDPTTWSEVGKQAAKIETFH
jgi:hypothetical protein